MKKLFMMIMSVIIILGAFFSEGGTLLSLMAPTVIVPLILGSIFTTLFSFNVKEILETIKETFSNEYEIDKILIYQKGILVVRSLENAILFWSLTVVVMGIILILSNLIAPEHLGPGMAVAFLSLLYGFGLRAALFVPMKTTLEKKIFLVNPEKYSYNNIRK